MRASTSQDAKDMMLNLNSVHGHGDMEHVAKEIRNFSRKEYDMDEITLNCYNLFGKL
jgi:hypothetical protein